MPLSVPRTLFTAAGLLLVCFGLYRGACFSLETGNEPWFHPALCIDGGSYLEGMAVSAAARTPLDIRDRWHSAGYQAYLNTVFALFPDPDRIFVLLKFLAWLQWAAMIALVWWLGERYFSPGSGVLGAALTALSLKLLSYANLLQYEVVLGFLTTCYIAALTGAPALRSLRARTGLFALASVLLAAIVLVQPFYVFLAAAALVPLTFVTGIPARALNALRAAMLVPALVILAGWAVYQDPDLSGADAAPSAFVLGNNPNAQGYGFPKPTVVEPSGLSFILRRPGRFLWLVKERFLYLWDLKPDVWHLGNPVSFLLRLPVDDPRWFSILVSMAGLLTFAAGLWLSLSDGVRGGVLRARLPALWAVCGITLGPLVIYGSSRFLVPAVPLIALLQAQALLAGAGCMRKALAPAIERITERMGRSRRG